MEAGASKFVALDKCDAKAQLSRPEGCGVTAAPTAKNYEVKIAIGQTSSKCLQKQTKV
jgi:hypothetical protein